MSNKTIMLVENDVNLRQSIALVLQRTGYRVMTTDCVGTAVQLLDSLNYHLLIADINVPDARATLMPILRTGHPQVPILIMTDQSKAEAENDSLLFHAHYLFKPIPPESLLDSVNTLLDKSTPRNNLNIHRFSVNFPR